MEIGKVSCKYMQNLETVSTLNSFKFIEEVTPNRGKRYFLVGKVQQCTPNKNRRIYPAEMWDALHVDPEFIARLSSGRLVGSIGHPNKDQNFDPERTALTVREHWREGDEVLAKLEILADLPSGRTLLALYKSGVYLGVSSRGGGPSVQENGYEVLSVGFMLDGYDAVVDPSVSTAMPVPQFESTKKKFTSFMESYVKDATTEDLAYYNTVSNSVFGVSLTEDTNKQVNNPVNNTKSAMSDKLYQEAVRKNAALEQQVTKFKTESASTVEKFKTLESRHDALKTVATKLESANNASNKRITTLESKLAEANKRLEAAKQLLSASLSKTESVQANLNDTAARYEASKKLILAYESAKQTKAKTSLESHISATVSKFDESKRPMVQKLLSNCTTVESVDDTVKTLSGLVSTKKNPTLPKQEDVKKPTATKTESAKTESGNTGGTKLNPIIAAMKAAGKIQ